MIEVAVVFCLPDGGLRAWRRPDVPQNRAIFLSLGVVLALDYAFKFSAVMALMTPVILIGGMTLGWFTPTEAAVAAVMWSLFLGLVRYRSMTMKTLAKATFDTVGNHGVGAVHRHGGVDLRLAADGQPGGGDAVER